MRIKFIAILTDLGFEILLLPLERRCIRYLRYLVDNPRRLIIFGYLTFRAFANQSLRASEAEATRKSSMLRATAMKSDAEL